MLIQRAGTGTLPPPGFASPAWSQLSAQWDAIPPPSTDSVTLGPCTLTVGHDDRESDDLLPENEHDVAEHTFGWDNESPQRQIHVGKFRIEWRPISNGDFLAFWRKMNGEIGLPPSWVQDGDELKVEHQAPRRWFPTDPPTLCRFALCMVLSLWSMRSTGLA